MPKKTKTKKIVYKDLGIVEDPNKVIGSKKKVTKQVVKKSSLELEAEKNVPKKRFKFSKRMCDELEYYVNKYGDDYQAMARDKKNIYQDSPGQLRYKISKHLKLKKID